MTPLFAFNRLLTMLQNDHMPQAQVMFMVTLVREALAAPKVTNSSALEEENELLRTRIENLEAHIQIQEEKLKTLLPVDSPRRGRKKNEETP